MALGYVFCVISNRTVAFPIVSDLLPAGDTNLVLEAAGRGEHSHFPNTFIQPVSILLDAEPPFS